MHGEGCKGSFLPFFAVTEVTPGMLWVLDAGNLRSIPCSGLEKMGHGVKGNQCTPGG